MRNEKRKTSKKIAVAACAALAIACAWTGGSIGLKGAANAEETATRGESLFENGGAFYAITGASVKLHSVTDDDSADYNGIRFSFEMSEAQYALISGTQNGTASFNAGVTVGAYVVPVSMLSGIEEGVTPAAETIAAAAGAEHKEITADKWTKAASDAQADTQVYKSYLYVYDIPTKNMDSDLACYAYLKSGETELKTAVQVRSMQYVAKASVDAGEHTAAELERYLPEQSVTFKAEGLEDSVAKVKYGASVKEPASPVKDGYTFLNWVDKDGKTYDFSSAVKENITLTAKFKAKTYGLYDFTSYDTGALANNTISGLTFTGTSSQEIVYDEEIGKNVLKYTATFAGNQSACHVKFTTALLSSLEKFDYLTLKVKVQSSAGAYFSFRNWRESVYIGVSKEYGTNRLPDNGKWVTLTFDNTATKNSFTYDDLMLSITAFAADTEKTVYLEEIRGAYKEISIDENGIDLRQKFGLEQNEFSATFTDIDGNESAVADVTNFNSNVAGTLAVTVNKAGYAQSQFETKISIVSHYGNLLNLSAYKVGSAYSDTVTVVDYNGKKALQVVNSGAESSTVRVNIVNDAVLDLKKFDYIRVKVAMKYENASANVNLTLVDSKGSQYAWKDVGGGNNKFIESTVDVATANMTITSNSLGVTFKKWKAALQTSIITDLYCGYNDITTDSNTPLDLTAKLGLAASDFTATFTPENGAEQAVANVAAVDISAAGTLKITVKKSGYAATVLTIGVKAAS